MEGLTHIRAAIVAAHRAIACERAAQMEPHDAAIWNEVAAGEHRKKMRALAMFERCGAPTPQALRDEG